MNVKELKEILANVPDNFEVRYEYDGPDANAEVLAKHCLVSKAAHCILLCETE